MVAQLEKEEYLATAKVGAVAAGELWPLISDRNRAGLRIDGHSRDMAEQAFEDAKQHRHDVEDELGTLLPSALDDEQRRADLRLELELATDEQDRAWELLEAAEERIERWGQRP
jgi:hypothetical protein